MRTPDYPPVVKMFYVEHPDTANRLPTEVAEIRMNNNDIKVKDLSEGQPAFVVQSPYVWPVATEFYSIWIYLTIVKCMRQFMYR